jgi:N-acetyl-alpha-D-muramate 1-phosphate uridylyltransferase
MHDTVPTIAVLAGGLATRLGQLTKATPKALLDVCGRPFLSWQLELFASRGLRDVVLCVSHYADQIEEWVARNPIAGLRVRFSHDGPRRLGTGGALRAALPLLGSPFLVTYGDSYLRCEYLDVFRAFTHSTAEKPPLAMMTVFENQGRWDQSNIVYRDGRILRYDKQDRSPEMRHIDYGLGVLTAEAFDALAHEEVFDLAQVYQAALAVDRLAAYEITERFYEVGSHTGIEEFRAFAATLDSHSR